ncbi:MarR family winged helix-turn-helix transcriptional regulator [Kribbella sp. DT2]|uniref:MarR family winged helix-turn-helix transcriptional regulator n=1 Tax=Kribbella sp. DT2 TaxID=3393427 RepID=UPI003CEDE729
MPDQPLTNALVRVARLQRAITGHLLRPLGLRLGQELVMMQLWERGPQSQTELVRALDSDSATMTRTVRRLEHAGFVRVTASPTDKRATIVEATPASQSVRREVERIWAHLEESAAGDLTSTELAGALSVLRHVETNLARAATK